MTRSIPMLGLAGLEKIFSTTIQKYLTTTVKKYLTTTVPGECWPVKETRDSRRTLLDTAVAGHWAVVSVIGQAGAGLLLLSLLQLGLYYYYYYQILSSQ